MMVGSPSQEDNSEEATVAGRNCNAIRSDEPQSANNLDGSSENDKDMMPGIVNNQAHSEEMVNIGLPATSTSSLPANNNTVPTFHGSRSASHIGRKPAFGQTCSMKTLLQDGILQTGEKVLTLEYEGAKFFGDLRRDGTIMMGGTGPDDPPHIYETPVAWANHCCKMLNPESKPLNAWSSIRFRGKRLDSYKLKWYRAQKKPHMMNNNNLNSNDLGNSSNNSNIIIGNIIDGMNMNLPGNAANAFMNSSIVRHLQQQNLHNQQQQQGGSRLMVHNPITNYFPQYENPLKNKKLIKSVLISNNMDNDCKRLVAKSLDLSVDPCIMSQQMNMINDIHDNAEVNSDNNDNNNNSSTGNNANANFGDDNLAEDNLNNYSTNDDEAATYNNSINASNNNTCVGSGENNNHCTTLKTTVINYEQLGTRGPHNTHNPNTMVKCIPFSAVDRIQPFNVIVATNALLLVDFHSHLVSGEVAGYLAGSWDQLSNILTVTQAFPCRTSLSDENNVINVEEEIRQDIEKRNLTLVGWYHSHQGKYSNHPTIKDIQNQIEHQITMKDSSNGYIPCIGLICSPHDIRSEDDLSPSFQIYWVMPPPENFANHYGRPMQMYYSVSRDLFLTQDLLLEMRLLANYYTSKVNEMVDFKSIYAYNESITNLDKLSGSIKPKLPKDLQESEYPDEPAIWKAAVDHFWKFLKNLVIPPPEQPQDQVEEAQSQEGQVENAPSDHQVDEVSMEESSAPNKEPAETLDERESHEHASDTPQEES